MTTVPNVKGWNYPVVKSPSAILKGIMSKHVGNFDCFIYIHIHLFRTKTKLGSYQKVGINEDFCCALMPSEDTKILGFSQYQNLIEHHLLFMQILNV